MTSYKVNFDFKGKYEDGIWHSDITYVKVGKEHQLVLLIKDSLLKK